MRGSTETAHRIREVARGPNNEEGRGPSRRTTDASAAGTREGDLIDLNTPKKAVRRHLEEEKGGRRSDDGLTRAGDLIKDIGESPPKRKDATRQTQEILGEDEGDTYPEKLAGNRRTTSYLLEVGTSRTHGPVRAIDHIFKTNEDMTDRSSNMDSPHAQDHMLTKQTAVDANSVHTAARMEVARNVIGAEAERSLNVTEGAGDRRKKAPGQDFLSDATEAFTATAPDLTTVTEEMTGTRDDGGARTTDILATSREADFSEHSVKNNRPFSNNLENSDDFLLPNAGQKKANCRVLIFDLRDTLYNEREKQHQKLSTVLRKYLVQTTAKHTREAKFDFITSDLLAANVVKTAFDTNGPDLIEGLKKMNWNISRKAFDNFFHYDSTNN